MQLHLLYIDHHLLSQLKMLRLEILRITLIPLIWVCLYLAIYFLLILNKFNQAWAVLVCLDLIWPGLVHPTLVQRVLASTRQTRLGPTLARLEPAWPTLSRPRLAWPTLTRPRLAWPTLTRHGWTTLTGLSPSKVGSFSPCSLRLASLQLMCDSYH